MRQEDVTQKVGFNPLAGIRCFLTLDRAAPEDIICVEFQSPSGDSLFSDERL